MKIHTKTIYELPKAIKAIVDDKKSVPYLEQMRVKEFEHHVDALKGETHVIIPWSGGLDSTTALLMALESSKKVSTIFFNYGQPYAQKEQDNIQSLLRILNKSLYSSYHSEHINLNVKWLKAEMEVFFPGDWQHIFPMRNLIILVLAYKSIVAENKEIWFSPVQGEIPYSGGDKSEVFIRYMNALIQSFGGVFRTPISQLTKGDLLHWAKAHKDRMDIICKTISCFSPGIGHCGHCQACFNRAVAFHAANILNISGVPIEKKEMKVFSNLYKEKLSSYNYYSYRRELELREFIEYINNL